MKKFKVDKSQILSKEAQKQVLGGSWGSQCVPGTCHEPQFLVGEGEFGGVCAIADPAPDGGICFGKIENGLCCIY